MMTKPKIIKPLAVSGNQAQKVARAVSKLRTGSGQVANSLIGRSDEVTALTLAIMTRQHLMLEGLHGVAKSMLASYFFEMFEGRVFFKQFMANTQPDEVLGPMNSERYRKEAIWAYNVTGMLPDCEFAFLDEVYRAEGALLGSILGILNERKFKNDNEVMNCPLLTAVGTTNFISNTPELDAFHDRWAMNFKVSPLSNATLQKDMIVRFLNNDFRKPEEKLTLTELETIHKAVNSVVIPESHVELLVELVGTLLNQQEMSGRYISDRRLCIASRVLQASALLVSDVSDLGKEGELQISEDEFAHFDSLRYILVQGGNPAHASCFNAAYTKVIGAAESSINAAKQVRELEKELTSLVNEFQQAKKTKKALLAFHNSVTSFKAAYSSVGIDARKSRVVQTAYSQLGKILDGLELELAQTMPEEVKMQLTDTGLGKSTVKSDDLDWVIPQIKF